MRRAPHPTPFFPAWRPRLAPLGRRSASVVEPLRHATLTQIEQRFAGALPAALFAQNAAKDHSRQRIFTVARTLWGWIWQVLQANTSCREVVRQVQALFALHEAGPVDEDSGAYCVARRKLSQALLEKLYATSFTSAEKAAPKPAKPLLGGRPLRVVDGSGTRLADTPANRAAFAPSSSLHPGTGFPYLRIVALFSLLSGALLAQATGSLEVSERRLWFDLLSYLRPGDILLGDRAYGLYVVAALLKAAGVDLISTVPARNRCINFAKAKQHLGPNDALFVWKKSSSQSAFVPAEQWQSLPQEITVRVLRVALERAGARTENFFIITTLLDPVLYPAGELIATHVRRWRMEMCLDDLKTTLGMENLRCLTPAMVQKELLVFLTTHNLIRWLIASAATQEAADIERLSFKGSLDAFRQWSQAIAQCRGPVKRRAELWRELLRILAADVVPLRPGRSEPRAVKKRSKYPYLNRPRRQYVERWDRTKRRRMATAKKKAALN